MRLIIKSFSIKKLFGYKDVWMEFTDSYKIIVGENGTGKTTILNCLYYILQKDFNQLKNIKFESISLEYTTPQKRWSSIFSFTYDELIAFTNNRSFGETQLFRILSSNIKDKKANELRKIIYSKEIHESDKIEMIQEEINKLGLNFKTPSSYIYQNVKRLIDEYISIEFRHKVEEFGRLLNTNLIYFPTYRRVESSNMGIEYLTKRLTERYHLMDEEMIKDALNSAQMQFGMKDVESSIEKLIDEIKERTYSGFSSILGSLLSYELRDSGEETRQYRFVGKKIDIILERLGNQISSADKNMIIEYSRSSNLNKPSLNYLIGKLIKLYEDLEVYDEAIKGFRDICNTYLINKRFVYDESLPELYIESDNMGERLNLECLSSGEKQIISLFSKIFLVVNKKFFILIDEPELSLSIPWQDHLLSDVIRSEKCEFLLAVTHSPFIYRGDLERYTSSISDYVR